MTPLRLPNWPSRKSRALCFNLALLVVFSACGRVTHLTAVQPRFYQLDTGMEDPAFIGMIAPYKDSLDHIMNIVIGHCATSLLKDSPEGTLGNWACDAVLAQTNLQDTPPVDFVVLNSGGLRITELASGPVTVGKIYELMPFDNLVTILEANGEAIRALADHMAASGGWPVSATMRYEIRSAKAINITIHGQPLDDKRLYRFALPDFIANGGDRIEVLGDLPRTDLPLLIRDALIAEIQRKEASGTPIEASLDGRVRKMQ